MEVCEVCDISIAASKHLRQYDAPCSLYGDSANPNKGNNPKKALVGE